MEHEEDELQPTLTEVLGRLPLIEDDLYLRMQVTNLDAVDGYLRDLESELLAMYIEIERTPLPQAIFVSALSQLWVFGLYELLRTWRQRMGEVLKFDADLRALDESERGSFLETHKGSFVRPGPEGDLSPFDFRPYERVTEDPEYARRVRTTLDASELLFRRLEALRVSLAKHEIPRESRSHAFAPGYGRIDMLSGSIVWQVSLGRWEVDTVSRRAVADDIPSLQASVEHRVLSPAVQDKVRPLERTSYALKQVVATLEDGQQYAGVAVAWNKIVVYVLGQDEIPFEASQVIDVRPDPDAVPLSQQEPPDDLMSDL